MLKASLHCHILVAVDSFIVDQDGTIDAWSILSWSRHDHEFKLYSKIVEEVVMK